MGKITIGKLPEVNTNILQGNDPIPVWNSEQNTTQKVELNNLSDDLSAESIENNAEEIENLDEEKAYTFITEQNIQNQGETEKKIVGLSSQQVFSKLIQENQTTIDNIATQKVEEYIQQDEPINASNDSIETIFNEGEQIPNNYDLDNYINIGKYYKQDISDQNNTYVWKMKVEQMAPNWIRQSVKMRLPFQYYPSQFSQDYRDIKIVDEYTVTSDTERKNWKNYYTKSLNFTNASSVYNSQKNYYFYKYGYKYTITGQSAPDTFSLSGLSFQSTTNITNFSEFSLKVGYRVIGYASSGAVCKFSQPETTSGWSISQYGTQRYLTKNLGSFYSSDHSSHFTLYIIITQRNVPNSSGTAYVWQTQRIGFGKDPTVQTSSLPYIKGQIFMVTSISQSNSIQQIIQNSEDYSNKRFMLYEAEDKYTLVSQSASMNFNYYTYYEKPAYIYSNWYKKYST